MRSLFPTLDEVTAPAGAGANDPAVTIGARIPAELQTHYGGTVVAVAMWRTNADNYGYRAVLSSPPPVGVTMVEGIRSDNLGTAVVQETTRWYPVASGLPIVQWGNGDGITIYVGDGTNTAVMEYLASAQALFDASSSLYLDAGSSLSVFGAFEIDGRSAPRGLITADAISGNPILTVSSATEVVIATSTDQATWVNGRAYRFSADFEISPQTAVAHAPVVRFHVGTSTSGTTLARIADTYTAVSGRRAFHAEAVCVRTAGSDLTNNWSTTIAIATATGVDTVRITGDLTGERMSMTCEDIGASSAVKVSPIAIT